MRLRRSLFAAAFLVAVAGTSYAMSDGNYDPEDMGCKPEGNAFDPANDPDGVHDPHANPDRCQTLRIGAGTDANPKFVRVGLDHEEPGPGGFAGGHNPHHGTAYVGSPGEEILEVHYGTGITQAILVDVLFFGPGEDGPLSDDHDRPELEIKQFNPENAEHIDQNPPKEVHAFFGADDNLESGEHDGVPEQNCEDDGMGGEVCYDNTDLANGPSDGGEIRVDVTPDQDDPASNVDPGNPDNVAPGAYAGTGACVDGICFNAGTGERQVYDGGQPGTVYLDDATADDYKDTDDYCSYDNEGNCVREVHDQQQDFSSRPGVNIYADPDPQDSSLGPFDGSTNTHIGTGGIKIFGVSVVDAQNPTAVGSSAVLAVSMQHRMQGFFLALARTPGMLSLPNIGSAASVGEAIDRDVLHQGAALSSPAAIQGWHGKATRQHGPVAATKAASAGVLVLGSSGVDEALEIAALVPTPLSTVVMPAVGLGG
jgi:hypothetical protein